MSDFRWLYKLGEWAQSRRVDLCGIIGDLETQPAYRTAREQWAQGASDRVLRQLLDKARLQMQAAAGEGRS